jgi:hypothetical protein
VGVVVRMIMEARGWRKTGRKGSLGVRDARSPSEPNHNTGGLAFWFIRAERYECAKGIPFRSVRQRCRDLETQTSHESPSVTTTPRTNGSTSKAVSDVMSRGAQA